MPLTLTEDELKTVAKLLLSVDDGRVRTWSGTLCFRTLREPMPVDWGNWTSPWLCKQLEEKLPELKAALFAAGKALQREEAQAILGELGVEIVKLETTREELEKSKALATNPAAKRKCSDQLFGNEHTLKVLKKHQEDSARVLEKLADKS